MGTLPKMRLRKLPRTRMTTRRTRRTRKRVKRRLGKKKRQMSGVVMRSDLTRRRRYAISLDVAVRVMSLHSAVQAEPHGVTVWLACQVAGKQSDVPILSVQLHE